MTNFINRIKEIATSFMSSYKAIGLDGFYKYIMVSTLALCAALFVFANGGSALECFWVALLATLVESRIAKKDESLLTAIMYNVGVVAALIGVLLLRAYVFSPFLRIVSHGSLHLSIASTLAIDAMIGLKALTVYRQWGKLKADQKEKDSDSDNKSDK